MSVPVTVLGGFLGAGKTTAVNHLLRHAACRVGVLVNDFGAVNVDAHLIAARDGDMVALSNGCVCCALGPDFGESLSRLLRRTPAPERIVVEASGVSDPRRIGQLVRLERGVALDGVLVLVDAANFLAHLADRWLTDTLERQVARADLILLSKCDLADAAARAGTRAAVSTLRPDVGMLEISGGAVPMAVLGVEGPAGPETRLYADAPVHGLSTWHWPATAPLDDESLRAVLTALPSAVLRAKGICRIGTEAVPHLLQWVGRRWTLTPWQGEAPDLGLTLIGTPEMPGANDLARRFGSAILRP